MEISKTSTLKCLMLILMMAGSLPSRADGNQDSVTAIKDTLEEVKITASRIPLSLKQAVRSVTILDHEIIGKMPVNTVNDLLKFTTGVDVRQRGGNGMQTDISIRGGTADQIGVYIDGICISDAQTGHNVFSIPLEISDIERIEILEGPAGRTYGPSSMMGAINIITKKERSSSVSARLEGGSFGTVETGARIHYTTGKFSNSLSGGYGRSDGYSRSKDGHLNADWQTGHLFYKGHYDGEQTQVGWHFGFLDKDFGSNTFYSTASDEQFEHVRKYFVAVNAETNGKVWKFKPSVYWNRSEDRFEFFKGQPDKSAYNYHQTDAFGVNLNNEISWRLGKTALGAEMRNEGVISTNLGEPLNKPSGPYKNGLNRTNVSFFLEHTVLLRRFTISAGVAAVKNTGDEMKFGFYPGADISWRFAEGWNAYASWNTSLRMPTFTELYYSVGGHKADKFLKPEQVQSAELGLKYQLRGIYGRLNLYYTHGSDLVDWIKDIQEGEDAPWKSVNHGAINTMGVQPQFRIDFREMLGYEPFVRSFILSYNYIWQDKKTGKDLQSKYALEYLRHKLSAQIDFNIWNRLYLTLSGRWQDRCGNYMKDGQLVAYQPYTLLDAQLSWDSPAFRNIPAYKVFVCGNNLLNKTWYDYGNIPQPGIWIRAGISCTFGI